MLASAAAGAGDGSLWSPLLDNAFTLTLLLLFAAAVLVALVRRYRRDECLALLDDFHATFADAEGRAIWGDLVVTPNGLEVRFDAAHRTFAGLTKTSALLYSSTVRAGVGLCRPVDALTPDERMLRDAQLRRSIRPGPLRRALRTLGNLVNVLRDALTRTLALAVDEVASSIHVSTPLDEPTEELEALRSSLERSVARAYDPLLERHIGRPVVLRLVSAAAPEHPLELPGYLVEYTQDWLAVFNVASEPFVEHELEIRGDHRGPGLAVQWKPPRLRILCTGPEVLVVKEVRTATRTFVLDCALLRGSFAELRTDDADACTLRVRLTRRVDVVCPRERGTITHGGERDELERTPGPDACSMGAAPCEPAYPGG